MFLNLFSKFRQERQHILIPALLHYIILKCFWSHGWIMRNQMLFNPACEWRHRQRLWFIFMGIKLSYSDSWWLIRHFLEFFMRVWLWRKQTRFADSKFSVMCQGWNQWNKQEAEQRDLRSGTDGETIRTKRKETQERDGEVEGAGEHVLLSVCPLIPLDFFCLPFPRSQC